MSDQPHYPYRDGDVAVLGPDVTATGDGMTITWQGANYRRDHGGQPEQLVQIGWYCWRCHGINPDPCRSDAVPIHVPAEWATDMRTEIEEDHDEPGPAATQATEPHTGLVVEPYRNDRGEQAWVFRCWGSDSCDGWLSLDHYSEQSAERARDRHVAEEHAEPPEPATVTDREYLRRLIAEALRPGSRDRSGHYPEGLMRDVDAVLRVRDRHLQQLRQRLQLADQLGSENTELHRYHAEDRDALTEMRATITRLRGEREQQRQRADQAEDLLRIAHDTSNTSEAERARAVQRADRLAADLTGWKNLAAEHQQATIAALERADRLADTLRTVLAGYDATGCLNAVKHAEYAAVLEEQPGHGDGPSVREAAADDRAHWNTKYAGDK